MSAAVAARDGRAPGPAGGRRRVFHRCSCGRPIPEGVSRCSARTCPEFAPTWARDTRRRLLENLRTVKLSVMFSVTAPGADLYPFDPKFCSHPPTEKCSGRIGCKVNPEMAEAFNHHAGKWWSELHRAAKTRADRATVHKGKIAARVWEKQKRGLAHLHGVLAVTTPAELCWAQAYVTALRELAPRYGFGFVDGWEKIGRKFWPGDQAGAYLSGYFIRGRGGKAPITENVLAGDLPRLVVFVGRDLTSTTGCTMRSLRAYPAWRDPWLDGEVFFVVNEGGGHGSCEQGRWLADPGLAVGADAAAVAGAAAAPVGLSSPASAEP